MNKDNEKNQEKKKQKTSYVICKICNMKIDEDKVSEHLQKTNHNEFRPFFDDEES